MSRSATLEDNLRW